MATAERHTNTVSSHQTTRKMCVTRNISINISLENQQGERARTPKHGARSKRKGVYVVLNYIHVLYVILG